MSTQAQVEPGVLRWAQQRSNRDEAAFDQKFTAWEQWLSGSSSPTFRQLEEIARYAHVPFGALFLPEPPVPELPIPDYRLGSTSGTRSPSQDLLDVVELSQQRQAWFREYAQREGIDAARIERATLAEDPIAVAAAVSAELNFGVQARLELRARHAARNHLRSAFEGLGGLSVVTSMVGNNAARPLDRDEFRGFSLSDDIAPLIFVNSAGETLGGQLFTFLHEYAHVKLGKGGVSDEHDFYADPANTSAPHTHREAANSAVERWCNAVAAEVLVPHEDLHAEFQRDEEITPELDRLAKRYLCSTLVILLRLRDRGLVASDGFDAMYSAEADRVHELAMHSAQQNGGSFWNNQPFRIGERLSRALLRDVQSGGTGYSEAFHLLGLRNTKQLTRYAAELG